MSRPRVKSLLPNSPPQPILKPRELENDRCWPVQYSKQHCFSGVRMVKLSRKKNPLKVHKSHSIRLNFDKESMTGGRECPIQMRRRHSHISLLYFGSDEFLHFILYFFTSAVASGHSSFRYRRELGYHLLEIFTIFVLVLEGFRNSNENRRKGLVWSHRHQHVRTYHYFVRAT